MARVKVTAKKSTIEGIVPRYNLAVQAARRICERSVPNDTYNKRAIFYSSPDQIDETDTTESFEIDSEKTDSVDFTMSTSSRETSFSNSDEEEIICSVGLTTKGRGYQILHDFLRNRQDKIIQENLKRKATYNAVTIFLGYK